MPSVTGIIEAITARPTSIGDMYDVVVNGTKYGNGKYAPRGVNIGDTVTFDFDVKINGRYENKNIIPRTMRVVDAQPSVQTSAPAQRSSGGVVSTQVDKRQETISKQSAMNTALTLIGLQLQYGAVKLPAKAPDAYTVLNTLFADTVARVYNLNTGDKWKLTAADFAPKQVAEDDAEADFADDDIPF